MSKVIRIDPEVHRAITGARRPGEKISDTVRRLLAGWDPIIKRPPTVGELQRAVAQIRDWAQAAQSMDAPIRPIARDRILRVAIAHESSSP